MQQSLSKRLAALEALEALEQDSIARYLPPERYTLARQLLAAALIFDFGQDAPARFALHAPSYPDNPQFRASLAQRCAALDLDLSFTDLQALCAWLNDQAPGELAANLAPNETDADVLTDDAVLDEACYGLADGHTLTCWNTGTFRVTFSNSAGGPRYWQRVAERAQALCTARGIMLFPMTTEEIHAAIDLIAREVFFIRPHRPQFSDSYGSVIMHRSSDPEYHAHDEQKRTLVRALDCCRWQSHGSLLETREEILELLAWACGAEMPAVEPLPTKQETRPMPTTDDIPQPAPPPPPPPAPVAYAIGADTPPANAEDFFNGFVKRTDGPQPKLSAEDRELIQRRSVKWGRR
jgi:hypothetical protein